MKHWWGHTLRVSRTLHIYLSLAALLTLLYFAVSGFVMNHEEWFAHGEAQTASEVATVPSEVRAGSDLAVVEFLRAKHGAAGEVTSVVRTEEEVAVQFRAPGRTLDARISLQAGEMEIRREHRGLYGMVAEMHRGKNTGRPWKLVMDVTAVIVVLGVVSGFVLWMGLRTRRKAGLVGLVLSAGVVVTVFVMAVRG